MSKIQFYTVPMSRVFVYSLGDQGSIPVCVIPKTKEMVLDTYSLNTQHYKGKVRWSREKCSTLP